MLAINEFRFDHPGFRNKTQTAADAKRNSLSKGSTSPILGRAKGFPGAENLQRGTNISLPGHSAAAAPICATASLLGPFRLIREDGIDITPGSALRQAILAVLVTAPGQIKARRALQDMFWSAAAPERASASLRSALYMLRQDLDALGGNVLNADRQTIALESGRILPGPGQMRGPSFLEGMDLPLDDPEPFEDWLRELRDAGPQAAELAEPGDRTAPRALSQAPLHMALGLLPPMCQGASPGALVRAEAFVDTVVHFLVQTTLLDIHDLREPGGRTFPLPITSGKGVTHWLQPVISGSAAASSLRLRLIEAGSRRLIWISDPIPDGPAEDAETAYPLGELVVERMHANPAAAGSPDLFPLTALTALFSLDAALIAETETQLLKMIDQGGPPVIECLRVFTQVFKVNEGFGPLADLDAARLCELVAAIPTSDPLLPLCQSLVGYSVHMLLAENDLANHLVENACLRAPHLALNLDHTAVLRMAKGDIDGAEVALKRCLSAGALSPWRYTYEVTGAMIYLTKGDLPQALHFANQALFRKPRYLGALRYAMAALALSGNDRDARRMLSRIRLLRPDYDLGGWAEGIVRRTPPELGSTLVRSLERNALL